MTKIVIVGGGFGGVYTLKYLHRILRRRGMARAVSIALVSEKNYFLFTPLLHEVATGGISPGNIVEPIREVLGSCLDGFYLARMEKVNAGEKTVSLSCGSEIPYDYLVLAPGSETHFYGVSGAPEHSFTLKTLSDAVRLKNRIIGKIEEAAREKDPARRRMMLSFAVVGGGPTGVELAAEICELLKSTFSHYYKKEIIESASVTLFHRDSELLPRFAPGIRRKALEVLKKKGVRLVLGREVVEIRESGVLLQGGEEVQAETVVWVAGVRPREIAFDAEVSKDKDGRLVADECLRLFGYEDIFVLGDVASVRAAQLGGSVPALAQAAHKEAAQVAENIFLLMTSGELKPFKYRHSGDLVSLGQWRAASKIAGAVLSGRFAWWLWRTVYLFKMISFRKKVKVAIDWTLNIFSPRDISEL